MLLWAIFTLGFMFGVFLTLTVLLGHEKVEEFPNINILNDLEKDAWKIHRELIKPNVDKKSYVVPAQSSV